MVQELHRGQWYNNSAVIRCIRKEEEGEYRTLINIFVEWTEQNHPRLNINKTREIVSDFRKKKTPSQLLWIRWEAAEVVEDYKYLRVVSRNRLDCI